MIILYVAEQEFSKIFYAKVLGLQPRLHDKGMTELALGSYFVLGLMPENGIARIPVPFTPHPASGNGIPRTDLYLFVDNPTTTLELALPAGAKLISTAQKRDWGDAVAYCADSDGHNLAFAK